MSNVSDILAFENNSHLVSHRKKKIPAQENVCFPYFFYFMVQ